LKSNLPQTSKLDYPQVVAPLSNGHHFACEFQQKVLSVMDRVQVSYPVKGSY